MNYRFLIGALLSSVILFSGCEEKTSVSTFSEDKAYDALFEEIVSFEETNGFYSSAETKGFWRKLARIAEYDAGGFLLGSFLGTGGGLFCGIMSSMYHAAFVIAGYDQAAYEPGAINRTFGLAEMAPSLSSVGLEHNLVLRDFYTDRTISIVPNDPVSMINKLILVYKRSHPDFPFSSYDELVAACPKIEDMINCTSEDELMELFLSNVSSEQELLIVKRILRSVVALRFRSDLPVYGDGLQTIISNSAISNQAKERLTSILSIGLYSRTFWDYEMQ